MKDVSRFRRNRLVMLRRRLVQRERVRPTFTHQHWNRNGVISILLIIDDGNTCDGQVAAVDVC